MKLGREKVMQPTIVRETNPSQQVGEEQSIMGCAKPYVWTNQMLVSQLRPYFRESRMRENRTSGSEGGARLIPRLEPYLVRKKGDFVGRPLV